MYTHTHKLTHTIDKSLDNPRMLGFVKGISTRNKVYNPIAKTNSKCICSKPEKDDPHTYMSGGSLSLIKYTIEIEIYH